MDEGNIPAAADMNLDVMSTVMMPSLETFGEGGR
jgi:hypothetical protein